MAASCSPPTRHVGRVDAEFVGGVVRKQASSSGAVHPSRGSRRSTAGAACGHGPAKRQPGSGSMSSGTVPSIATSCPRRCAGDGMAPTRPRVYGCSGVCEDLGGGADLRETSRVHHGDPVADPSDEREVVADVEDRHVVALLQLGEQIDDASLDRDVERRGRFVGDQQLRSAASACAIITRCFMPPESSCGYRTMTLRGFGMRVSASARAMRSSTTAWSRRVRPANGGSRSSRRSGQRDRRWRHGAAAAAARGRSRPRASSSSTRCSAKYLGQLLTDRQTRVQRLAWILEDHRDVVASDAAHPAARRR